MTTQRTQYKALMATVREESKRARAAVVVQSNARRHAAQRFEHQSERGNHHH